MLGKKPEPILRCDPARNLVATPFIQAQVLRIQRKLRKGKFFNAANEKQLRLTISTSNFVSLMGYRDIVGTAADKVKVWVPRNVLPMAILRSQTLVSRASTLKRKVGRGNGGIGKETAKSKGDGHEWMMSHTTMGPASGDVIEISSSSDEEPNDPSTKRWLGFLDLMTPESAHKPDEIRVPLKSWI